MPRTGLVNSLYGECSGIVGFPLNGATCQPTTNRLRLTRWPTAGQQPSVGDYLLNHYVTACHDVPADDAYVWKILNESEGAAPDVHDGKVQACLVDRIHRA